MATDVVAYENLVNNLTGNWMRDNNNPDIPMSVQRDLEKQAADQMGYGVTFSDSGAPLLNNQYGLPTNTMGGVTLNPDGSLNYNNQSPNLGFRSMVDMAADTENFDNQFNNNFADYNMSGPLRGTNTMRGSVIGQDMDIRDYQSPMGTDVIGMDEMNTYDNRDFTNVGGLGIANEPDVEQVEYLGNPTKFQNFKSKMGEGINSLKNKASSGWDLAQKLPGMAMGAMTGIPGIGMLMGALGNQFEDRTLGTSNVVDEYGNVFDSESLNKQNALGGGYTDAARSSRRALARYNNMLERKALKKTYSKTNLKKMKDIQLKQQQLDNAGYTGTPGGNVGSGVFAKFDQSGKTYGPYSGQGGNQGSNKGSSGGVKTGAGRNPWGRRDGGRVGYGNGGLATLFTRRG